MKLFGSNRYYGVMARNSVILGSDLRSGTKISGTSHLKILNGLALMGHSYLLGYHNINHWFIMGDIKLFGSNRYGVMARNSVILGSCLRFEVRNQNFWHITPQNT
jgi:hypothetical protein